MLLYKFNIPWKIPDSFGVVYYLIPQKFFKTPSFNRGECEQKCVWVWWVCYHITLREVFISFVTTYSPERDIYSITMSDGNSVRYLSLC